MLNGDLSIFDFCETLVDFQTADRFVHYVIEHEGEKRISFLEKVRKTLNSIGIMRLIDFSARWTGIHLNKQLLLYRLKGLTKEQIENYAKMYYLEEIRPHFINPVIDKLQEDKKEGLKIVIISASYLPVLKNFQDEFEVDMLITNAFQYENGFFTGRILECDCYGKEKVRRLERETMRVSGRTKIIKSYGDSRSDIPVLRMAGQGIVVSKSKSQPWCKKEGFQEIVW